MLMRLTTAGAQRSLTVTPDAGARSSKLDPAGGQAWAPMLTWLALHLSVTQSAMKAARSSSLIGLHAARWPSPNMTYGPPFLTLSTCTPAPPSACDAPPQRASPRSMGTDTVP
jgi:hypothetical protein